MRRFPLPYSPHNVIRVAPSGPAHARTLVEALALVKGPSASNRWLIELAPGDYELTSSVVIPRYVTVKGAGAGDTDGQGSWATRLNIGANIGGYATILRGNLVDLFVYTDQAQNNIFYSIYADDGSVIDRYRIHIKATGPGSGYCEAVRLHGSDCIIQLSDIVNESTGYDSHIAAVYAGSHSHYRIDFSQLRASGVESYGLYNYRGAGHLRHCHLEGESSLYTNVYIDFDCVSITGQIDESSYDRITESQIVDSERHGFMTPDLYMRLMHT
ncbi:MAG: hypothetical protein J7M34_12105, partial [Anaerolineae bacterium]|nr:hypothetical protein [Anaerolineae bacterium]